MSDPAPAINVTIDAPDGQSCGFRIETPMTAGELAERSSRFFGFRPGDVAALMAGHIVLRDDLALGEAVNYQRLQLVLIGGGV